jgi:hypothetical protein
LLFLYGAEVFEDIFGAQMDFGVTPAVVKGAGLFARALIDEEFASFTRLPGKHIAHCVCGVCLELLVFKS